MGAEFTERRFETLWQHASFADNGHEVRIANPAGNNVHVKVMLHPGSGATAEIHSEVEAIRMISLL